MNWLKRADQRVQAFFCGIDIALIVQRQIRAGLSVPVF